MMPWSFEGFFPYHLFRGSHTLLLQNQDQLNELINPSDHSTWVFGSVHVSGSRHVVSKSVSQLVANKQPTNNQTINDNCFDKTIIICDMIMIWYVLIWYDVMMLMMTCCHDCQYTMSMLIVVLTILRYLQTGTLILKCYGGLLSGNQP